MRCFFAILFTMHIAQNLQGTLQDLTSQAQADGIDQLAVGAAIVSGGKLLLVTRADEEEVYPKYVEIAGGSVDYGESLFQAVEREMTEETGLIPKTLSAYLGSFDFTLRDGRRVRQFNFLIEPETADVILNPTEHSSFHWLYPTDMAYLDTIRITPQMKECVIGICKKIGR